MLTIVRLGHPALRKKSVSVRKREFASKRFQTFLDSLADICLKSNGAGIAAPQVGVNKRIIVVHVDPKNPRYPGKKPFPLTIVINPKIVARSKEKREGWEGDLSVDLRGLVSRSTQCVVKGLDRQGNEVTFTLSYEFHARVFQHEIDHLNGIFFLDRVKNKASLSEYAEWKKYWKDR
jgi:peptide deformylase